MSDDHSERAQYHSALVAWAALLKQNISMHEGNVERPDERADVVYRKLREDIERLSAVVQDELAVILNSSRSGEGVVDTVQKDHSNP